MKKIEHKFKKDIECKKCHEEIHQQDGCKTSDLKCNKDIQQ